MCIGKEGELFQGDISLEGEKLNIYITQFHTGQINVLIILPRCANQVDLIKISAFHIVGFLIR